MKGFINEVMVIFITSLLQQLCGGPTAFLFPSPPPLDRSRAASPLSPSNSLGSVRSPAHDTMSVSSAASLGRRLELKDRKFEIPDLWRPSVMDCIQEQRLTPEARNEIVRDLVTHMYGFIEKPTGQFCKEVAKMLVEKYPFMADSGSTPSDLKSVSDLARSIPANFLLLIFLDQISLVPRLSPCLDEK